MLFVNNIKAYIAWLFADCVGGGPRHELASSASKM